MSNESEHTTRKKRIDTKLKDCGWTIIRHREGLDASHLRAHAVEEYQTNSGPADYALFVHGILIGIIEAKKVEVATANVLEQANVA